MSDVRVLEVEDLRVHFRTDDHVVHAVNGVSFHVTEGESLAIVGESGSGKSVTNLTVLRLIPQPPGEIPTGSIRYRGDDILAMSPSQVRAVRGGKISMIFQDPMTSLNPFLRISKQLTETIELHMGLKGDDARQRAIEMLDKVGIPDAKGRIDCYPHEFSGGMRQRVMIAMALSTDPDLLIADEPTTALDVTIQAQILQLIKRLQRERNMSLIMITHALAVVAGMCDRVAVMYGGKVVEVALVDDLFDDPRHPYTLALLRSIPRVDSGGGHRLEVIKGLPPKLTAEPSSCSFAPRCQFVLDRCRTEVPPLEPDADGRVRACFVPNPGGKPLPKAKADPPKADPPKADPPKADPPKADAPKADPPKADPPKADPPKADPPKPDPPESDSPEPEGEDVRAGVHEDEPVEDGVHPGGSGEHVKPGVLPSESGAHVRPGVDPPTDVELSDDDDAPSGDEKPEAGA